MPRANLVSVSALPHHLIGLDWCSQGQERLSFFFRCARRIRKTSHGLAWVALEMPLKSYRLRLEPERHSEPKCGFWTTFRGPRLCHILSVASPPWSPWWTPSICDIAFQRLPPTRSQEALASIECALSVLQPPLWSRVLPPPS